MTNKFTTLLGAGALALGASTPDELSRFHRGSGTLFDRVVRPAQVFVSTGAEKVG